jgi:hypothetical protein
VTFGNGRNTFGFDRIKTGAPKAFPAEVDAGSAWETRRNKNLECFHVSMKHESTLTFAAFSESSAVSP